VWDIQDFTGTQYTQYNTEIGHLLQSIYWLDNQQWQKIHAIIPWEYHNIVNVVKNDIYNWGKLFTIDISPIVSPIDNYCSTLTSDNARNDYQNAWSFMQIWDLQLHDAAVTYTYLAADTVDYHEANVYAIIACALWGYSRQLRVDATRPLCRNQIIDVIYPNLK
jgi:hypothetical protein